MPKFDREIINLMPFRKKNHPITHSGDERFSEIRIYFILQRLFFLTKTATPGTVPGKENEMSKNSKIFEEYYEDYCRQISKIDFESAKEILEIEGDGDQLVIPFFDRKYTFSGNEILDGSGKRPHYMVCVILAKYLLLCPGSPREGKEWVSFKDFKRTSHFTNVNYFASDTERAIVKFFSGKKEMLVKACEELGGDKP